MSVRRIVFNILLALVCALPLAALESRLNNERTDYFTPEVVKTGTATSAFLEPTGNSPNMMELASPEVSDDLNSKKIEHHYTPHIKKVAESHGVSPALVKAVIKVESGFDPQAVSSQGAVGLMQVMPETARRVGVSNPHDPHSNIVAGVKYLKKLLEMFGGNETLALAAYNSGPGNVLKYGGIPPYRQTQVFVNRVMRYYRMYLNS